MTAAAAQIVPCNNAWKVIRDGKSVIVPTIEAAKVVAASNTLFPYEQERMLGNDPPMRGRVVDRDLREREFSQKRRETLAGKHQAMPHGGFPIVSVGDLKNAVRAIGRAQNPAAAKAHIIKRARALKATHLLPSDWKGSTKQEQYGENDGPPWIEEAGRRRRCSDCGAIAAGDDKFCPNCGTKLAESVEIKPGPEGWTVEWNGLPVTWASLDEARLMAELANLTQSLAGNPAPPAPLPPPDNLWAATSQLQQAIRMANDCLETERPLDQGRVLLVIRAMQAAVRAMQQDMAGDAGKTLVASTGNE